jgi:hypothetical protein
VQRLVEVQARDVDLEEFRQILRQALHHELIPQVRHHAALGLHARCRLLALVVQRHRQADRFVLEYPLQVHVHDLVLPRVALHVAQDRRLRLVTDLQLHDRGVELLVVECKPQPGVVKGQRARFALAAVEDRGYAPRVTQAAARTLPLVIAELRGQFE